MRDERRYWITLEVNIPGPEAPFVEREEIGPTVTELELDQLAMAVAEDLVRAAIRARRSVDLPDGWFRLRKAARIAATLTMTFRDDRGTLPSVTEMATVKADYEADLVIAAGARALRLAASVIKKARRPAAHR